MGKFIVDTNILLSKPEILEKFDCVITSHVLRELENLETKHINNRQLQAEIRMAKRYIDNFAMDKIDLRDYTFNLNDEFDPNYVDNKLLQVAHDNNFGIITNDRLLRAKCDMYNIKSFGSESNTNCFFDNKGFKEVFFNRDELHTLYQDLTNNTYNLIVNEYLIVYDKDKARTTGEMVILDILRWDGFSLISLPRNKSGKTDLSFQSMQFGQFTPRDGYQMIAVDSILNNQLTMIRGRAGTGKSKIALETAWHLIEREGEQNGYEKLVIFANPTPALYAQELGFYEGGRLKKLLQSSAGAMLSSKFGDQQEISNKIDSGKMDILPLVDVRGYETGERKTILWILEAQNMTSDLMKLALQRVSENTKVIIDGDYNQQVDKNVYEVNNGMKRVSEVFRGNELYGEVELQNIYRSDIAKIADKM